MAFAPVYTEHSRTLIVGTWPSPKSREEGFFYGHPQNRFWPLLAPIRRVLCNGAAAHRLCVKHHDLPGVEIVKLPSISPAHAAWGMARLTAQWRAALMPGESGARP